MDSYDFAAVRDGQGNLMFDTETPTGNLALLEHVLESGATTILWRNCGGATMRYQSARLSAELGRGGGNAPVPEGWKYARDLPERCAQPHRSDGMTGKGMARR